MSEREEQAGPETPWEIPITGELDLHAFAPADIPSLVEEYLLECRRRQLTGVRLVHGRGKGVQRAVVLRLLARLPFVLSFRDAPAASGGWGATLVNLSVGDHDHSSSS